MLKSHFNANEDSLFATSRIPSNSGHSLHKGTPRESFIKEFLEGHLPDTVNYGTGEIIDANSAPSQQRNQYDIVLYKRNYPKLDFGGGISAFLCESVVATIEVKSTLTEAELESAVSAARNAKQFQHNSVKGFHQGYIPPSIRNYVVAYDGPAKIQTVHGWIGNIYSKLGIVENVLDPTDEMKRTATSAAAIDGIFIIKNGFLYFDNVSLGFASPTVRQSIPDLKWVMTNQKNGNLLVFFFLAMQNMLNMQAEILNPIPYLKSFALDGIGYGK